MATFVALMMYWLTAAMSMASPPPEASPSQAVVNVATTHAGSMLAADGGGVLLMEDEQVEDEHEAEDGLAWVDAFHCITPQPSRDRCMNDTSCPHERWLAMELRPPIG